MGAVVSPQHTAGRPSRQHCPRAPQGTWAKPLASHDMWAKPLPSHDMWAKPLSRYVGQAPLTICGPSPSPLRICGPSPSHGMGSPRLTACRRGRTFGARAWAPSNQRPPTHPRTRRGSHVGAAGGARRAACGPWPCRST
eukprot:286567-Prymnesium_polylepis.1